MKKKRLLAAFGSICLALVLAALLLPACAAEEPAPAPTPTPTPYKIPDIIGIATSGIGSGGHSCGVAYAPVMEKFLGTRVRIMPSWTYPVSMLMVLDRKAQITGLGMGGYPDIMEGTYHFADQGWGPQMIRGIWRAYDAPYGFIVRGDSEVKTINDLKGKKISWYEGSPMWMGMVKAGLAFAGLTLDDVEKVPYGGYSACAKAVVEGKTAASFVASISTVTFEIAENPKGIRYLPMPLEDKEAWNRWLDIAPWFPPGIGAVGAEVAHGVPIAQPVYAQYTYGWMDEELVYQFARFFGEAYDEYVVKDKRLEMWSMESMRKYLDFTCLPTHSGTIRYLKEKGIWTSDDDARNKELIELQERYAKAWEDANLDAVAKGIRISTGTPEWMELWDSYREPLGHFKIRL